MLCFTISKNQSKRFESCHEKMPYDSWIDVISVLTPVNSFI